MSLKDVTSKLIIYTMISTYLKRGKYTSNIEELSYYKKL